MEKKAKVAAQTGIYLGIVAAILVVANVISYGAYKRVDMTKNERFSLSKGSARLVHDELKQDMQVDVYVTRGLPKFDAFIQDLTDLMNEYERAGEGKLHYALIEAKSDEQRAAAKEAGLQEMTGVEGNERGEDSATITKGYMGIVFKYGSEKEVIPMLSPDAQQGLEFWITNKIREIRDRADGITQKVGVITGKDEIKISDPNLIAAQPGRGAGPTLKSVMEQALPFYKIEDVDLKGGESEINQELVGLLITQPGKDFTEKELRRIDEFLMRGNKSLVIAAGAVNLKASDATMKATLDLHGLEKLTDGYGIEMKKEAVLDWARSIMIPVQTQTGQIAYIRSPGVVQAQTDSRLGEGEQLLDSSFAGFFRLEEISFPFPSTLVAHPEKQPEAKMQTIARTTPRTTVVTDDSVSMKYGTEWKPKGEFAQRAIAITVEGKLKSAFGAGEKDGISLPADSKDKSRVLVISASEFLANPFARSGNAPPMPPQMAMMGGGAGDEELMMISQPYAQKYLTSTILAFKNILDWMAGDSSLLAASAKLLGEPNLTYSDIAKPKADTADDDASMSKKAEDYKNERKRVQERAQWTLMLFPPALFALYGLFRWQRRQSARLNVSLS